MPYYIKKKINCKINYNFFYVKSKDLEQINEINQKLVKEVARIID